MAMKYVACSQNQAAKNSSADPLDPSYTTRRLQEPQLATPFTLSCRLGWLDCRKTANYYFMICSTAQEVTCQGVQYITFSPHVDVMFINGWCCWTTLLLVHGSKQQSVVRLQPTHSLCAPSDINVRFVIWYPSLVAVNWQFVANQSGLFTQMYIITILITRRELRQTALLRIPFRIELATYYMA